VAELEHPYYDGNARRIPLLLGDLMRFKTEPSPEEATLNELLGAELDWNKISEEYRRIVGIKWQDDAVYIMVEGSTEWWSEKCFSEFWPSGERMVERK
jgi:hypothetical protein